MRTERWMVCHPYNDTIYARDCTAEQACEFIIHFRNHGIELVARPD